MADLQRLSAAERDIDQAITSLKKGAHLLKYGRRGKPKFCPFRLSTDESTLIWYYGKDEKRLDLRYVSRIIPGQRTAVFQRYPRPEKEYQSFSLIHNDRSLDLICKDKDEAEVWFVGLKALIERGSHRKARSETASSESPRVWRVSRSSSFLAQDLSENQRLDSTPQSRLGKVFAEVLSFTASSKNHQFSAESPAHSFTPHSAGAAENSNARTSGTETIRVSLSSALSSSSQGSYNEDFDNLGDVFIWGEGTGNGVMGGGLTRIKESSNKKSDALVPKALESTGVLDVQSIACGQRHAILVTKHGEVYSWGEEAGGRLGHGMEADIFHPKLIETLNGKTIEMVACGDYHTCAVTLSGDLYTWGDGSSGCGLLGHGTDVSHWIPKRVNGPTDGFQITFVSCGPWHTALLTSTGHLFTFGDGTFGALGHGDRSGTSIPREVEALKGLHAQHVACGVWHTAAVVKLVSVSSTSRQGLYNSSDGKLYTWGDGEYGQLGHGDDKPRLVPERVSSLVDIDFSQVACGNNLTVALTTSGNVYTMGKDGKPPTCIKGSIANCCVDEIACGSHHIAVLTSKAEVYTWGKGANGQLGHGDNEDRNTPTLVTFLKEKHVKSIACGSNFTAVICLHKWISSADISVCSGCHNPFNFMRKRHNCYNCGLGICTTCSTRKSVKASLAPSLNKPYRVCDDCFTKLQKTADHASVPRVPYVKSASTLHKASDIIEREPGIPRMPASMSRLSFTESLKCDRMSSFSVRPESVDNRMFPLRNGNMPRPSTSSKSPSSPYGSSPGSLSFIVHDSRVFSQSPSPVLGKRSSTPSPSPSLSFRTLEATPDELRSSNDILSMELKSLRAQVERLSTKSQSLESELERKSEQLKEVAARAADEAEKSQAAKEVIKSLTAQLKDMAERGPKKQVVCSHLDSDGQMSNDTNGPSNGSVVTVKTSPKSEPSGSSSAPLSNGTEAQLQKSERTIQDEPGVYITLAPLQNGVNELRRVRFSRRQYTEEQAEKWWTENETRLCEQHNIRTA
ncbi:PH, RCC1 and FYVE domains-containing protein 1-like [Salvia divinorum]|uniref:PH, RCC1 and FYVE domains-containing protein 1-like n=1 Tax=Salvia divinorum TaxID=28513 RepID=A0ABD1H3M7_SALDI